MLGTWHIGVLVVVTTSAAVLVLRSRRCPAQTPPNPTAAEPDGRRVLSRVGAADHAVTPQAPWTGSGWREYSYGGFGGGHPGFHAHATSTCNPNCNLSAWEVQRLWLPGALTWRPRRSRVTVVAPSSPWLMAR